jgi:predicted nucleotidyltransferase
MDGTSPREALRRLRATAESGELDDVCDRLGVRVLSAFGSATTADGTAAGDLDLGVSFVGAPDVLALLAALARLTGFDGIDLVLLDGADPLVRAEALVGVPLYERERGDFATAQMAALAERRDTEWLRRLDLDALGR